MPGETKTFRKKMFGGFDPRDVAEYITELARERNTYSKAADDAEKEIQELRSELAAIRDELCDTERRLTETRTAVLDGASDAFIELEASYEHIRADIGAVGDKMRTELSQVDDAIALLSRALSQAKERLSELRRDDGEEECEETGGTECTEAASDAEDTEDTGIEQASADDEDTTELVG